MITSFLIDYMNSEICCFLLFFQMFLDSECLYSLEARAGISSGGVVALVIHTQVGLPGLETWGNGCVSIMPWSYLGRETIRPQATSGMCSQAKSYKNNVKSIKSKKVMFRVFRLDHFSDLGVPFPKGYENILTQRSGTWALGSGALFQRLYTPQTLWVHAVILPRVPRK